MEQKEDHTYILPPMINTTGHPRCLNPTSCSCTPLLKSAHQPASTHVLKRQLSGRNIPKVRNNNKVVEETGASPNRIVGRKSGLTHFRIYED
jgi:hypothetical protein